MSSLVVMSKFSYIMTEKLKKSKSERSFFAKYLNIHINKL